MFYKIEKSLSIGALVLLKRLTLFQPVRLAISCQELAKKGVETRDFRKLNIRDKAHHFLLQVYRNTKNFPSDERFGLTVHLRRAAAPL